MLIPCQIIAGRPSYTVTPDFQVPIL